VVKYVELSEEKLIESKVDSCNMEKIENIRKNE
jgi:hypothetical protein